MSDEARHESPYRKELLEGLARMGEDANPVLRKAVQEALTKLDDTDPQRVGELLPPEVLAFCLHTLERAMSLVPLAKHADEAGCFIESILLNHGLIQFSLRGLYVLAWQRAAMPCPLTATQLAPYYEQGSRQGDVYPLVNILERNGLVQAHHATHLRKVNSLRNSAAHGVIFGEIAAADLAEASRGSQWAALGALQRFRGWFGNPQPLTTLPK